MMILRGGGVELHSRSCIDDRLQDMLAVRPSVSRCQVEFSTILQQNNVVIVRETEFYDKLK